MKEKELIDIWKREESVAHIHGGKIYGRNGLALELSKHHTGLLKTRNETAGYRYWWW